MIGKSSNAGRRDSGSVGWLLSLIFVCLAAGIVAAGNLYYRNYEKHYRSEIERQLSAIADLKVDGLVQWRKERLADGAVFFRNASFSGFVRRFFENPEDAQAQQQIQAWVEKYRTANQYDHVRLLDAQGGTRLSVPAGLPAVSSSVAKNVSEALRSGQVTFQDFYRSDNDQEVHLAVLVPILYESDASRPLGVLVLRIDPQAYLYPFIQRWPTPSLTAETLLIRREGNEVVFLNELRFQKNTALTLRAPLDQKALPAARAALGQEGVMEGIDYQGEPVVAALRAIPDSPWSLVARMDAAEVYAPLRERLWQIVVLIGAVLFGAAASIALLWRQQRVQFYRKEAAAENRTRRMATVVRDSNDAITIQDFEGRITAWNRGAELMYGYSEHEALRMKIWQLAPPNKAAELKDFNRRLFAGEKVASLETQRVTKDGRILDVWLTVTKLADDEGQVIGIASTERDITARKRAEAELGATQRRFQELFDNVIVGLLRTTSGPEGAFIDVNPAMVKMFEADSREQLMAVHPSEIYLDPSQRRIVSDAIVSQGFIKDQEVRFKTLKGRSILCRIAAVKETDANGQVYFDSTIEDITERKRAEEALRRQTGELRARNEELARFNNAAVGRELRMVELKKQVNELCRQMGKPLLYPLDFLSAESQASTAAETVKCRESKSET